MTATITNETMAKSEEEPAGVEALFRPFDLKGLHLNNRLVMAPMTRSQSPGGVPGANVADYYRRRAEGGAGLLITEGVWVPHPTASNELNVPRFYGEDALAGWAETVRQVHAAGAAIMPQLWHIGLTVKPQIEAVFGREGFAQQPTMGPSGIRTPGTAPEAPPMTQADIASVVDAFATAAASAQDLGFDGIEIHGAHGYLLDQFFWPETNKRTDGYGGGPAARARFAAEVVGACRGRVEQDFPIVFRLSQWKVIDYAARIVQTPQELEALLAPLVDAGVDAFHCSTRRYWEPEFEGSSLNLAGWVKKLTGKPTITVGSVGLATELLESLAQADNVEQSGIEALLAMSARDEFDLVAVGRAVIGDPEWPIKIRERRFKDIAPFNPMKLRALS